MKLIDFIGATPLLLASFFAFNPAQAAVFVGSVEQLTSVEDSFYLRMGRTDFSTSGGVVTLDVLGNGFLGGPHGVGLSDPFLYLFVNDGDIGADNFVALNDDSGSTFGDGSVTGLDSFLSVNLAAGNYTAFVGSCCDFTVTDFHAQGFQSFTGTNPALGTVSFVSDYQLTITGPDVALAPTVPLPAALPLILSAFAGLGFAARRRRPS